MVSSRSTTRSSLLHTCPAYAVPEKFTKSFSGFWGDLPDLLHFQVLSTQVTLTYRIMYMY